MEPNKAISHVTSRGFDITSFAFVTDIYIYDIWIDIRGTTESVPLWNLNISPILKDRVTSDPRSER